MSATLQGPILAALLLVPGFLHYTIAKGLRVWEGDDSETAMIFTSVGLTGLVVALEMFLVGLVAIWWHPLSDQLADAFENGIARYSEEHPGGVLAGVGGIFLLNTAVLGLAGCFDPLGSVRESLHRNRRTTSKSALYLAFRPDVQAPVASSKPEQKKDDVSTSSARTASRNRVLGFFRGDPLPRYSGWVGTSDMRPDRNGERFIQLWHAERWDGTNWVDARLGDGVLSAVLLKFSEIASIEITYTDRPYTPSDWVKEAPPLKPPVKPV